MGFFYSLTIPTSNNIVNIFVSCSLTVCQVMVTRMSSAHIHRSVLSHQNVHCLFAGLSSQSYRHNDMFLVPSIFANSPFKYTTDSNLINLIANGQL